MGEIEYSKNTEEMIQQSETYEVDDQTYYEDISGLDSMADKSKMLSVQGNKKQEASFDITIGNQKIVLEQHDKIERVYFDEYIEENPELEDNDAQGRLDNSSLMYNSFISDG